MISAYVKHFGQDAEPFLLIGIDPIIDRPLRSWRVAKSHDRDVAMWLDLLKEPYTLVLGNSLARTYDYAAGDEITLDIPGKP